MKDNKFIKSSTAKSNINNRINGRTMCINKSNRQN